MQVVHNATKLDKPAQKVKRVPLYNNPVFMAQALERIFKHQDEYLAKQKLKTQYGKQL